MNIEFPWSKKPTEEGVDDSSPETTHAVAQELNEPATRGDLLTVVERVTEKYFAHMERAERSKKRSGLRKWLIIALMFLGGLTYLFGGFSPPPDAQVELGQKPLQTLPLEGKKDTAHVAFIPIEGTIDGDELGRPGFDNTTLYIQTALTVAQAQDNLSAVIFYINSNGGGAVASAQGHRLIKEFRELTKVPVYAYVSSHAYSGGYYLALGADKIIADPVATVGSVGVIIKYFNTASIGEVFGIGEIEIVTGAQKACLSQWKKLTPSCKAMFQRSVDVTFESFLKAMSESRNIPFDTLLAESKSETASRTNGAIFGAKDAVSRNMIDDMMTKNELYKLVSREIAKKNPNFKKVEFVQYDKKLGLLEEWKGKGAKTAESLMSLIDALSGKSQSSIQLRAE